MAESITGSCLCGACRYESDAEPVNTRACHCRICQKATGAPLYARVQVPLDSLRMTGPIGWYPSSPVLRRGFCTRCGSSLFSERASVNLIGLTVGCIDDPDRFTPDMQIWTSSKQAWVPLADGIPCHAEGPPA